MLLSYVRNDWMYIASKAECRTENITLHLQDRQETYLLRKGNIGRDSSGYERNNYARPSLSCNTSNFSTCIDRLGEEHTSYIKDYYR